MIVIADPLPITHCSDERRSLSIFLSIRPWGGHSEQQKELLSTSNISRATPLLSLSLSFLLVRWGCEHCSATFSGFLRKSNEVIRSKGWTAEISLWGCLVSNTNPIWELGGRESSASHTGREEGEIPVCMGTWAWLSQPDALAQCRDSGVSDAQG